MTRRPVVSSMLRSVGYEDATLEIEFINGTIYRFAQVPRDIYEALLGAESIGKFFSTAIRGGGFAVEKVEPQKDEVSA